MNRLKPTGIRTRHILLIPLTAALILVGLGTCSRNILQMDLKPSKPGFTMKQLDTKAKPFIDEAYATVPKAVANLWRNSMVLPRPPQSKQEPANFLMKFCSTS